MIDINELYNKTNGGLDIILYYCPEAEISVRSNKNFRYRDSSSDTAPSASLKQIGGVWRLRDFGLHDKAISPIDVCMEKENLTFTEALQLLGERYHIESSDHSRPLRAPTWDKRAANENEKEGDIIVDESEESLSEAHYDIFIPKFKGKNEPLEKLNWHLANSISYVKKDPTTKQLVVSVKKSNEHYPIFVRRCYFFYKDEQTSAKTTKRLYSYYSKPEYKKDYFYKVYEPLSEDKNYRFNYAPRGKKVDRYINGLYELKESYEKSKKEQEQMEPDSDKTIVYEKFDHVFICAGERDAACLKALGYFPIWFNSETFEINREEIKELYKYADTIYNIPDIDSTGVRRGKALARKYWNIQTIWLPDWLKERKDWRGNPRKDFRDFYELKPERSHFENLMTVAKQVQFWTSWIEKDKVKYGIDSVNLLDFLNTYGFCKLKNEITKIERPVHIDGYVVKPVKHSDIYNFLNQIAIERYLEKDIRNLLINSNRVNSTTLENMKQTTLDFDNYSRNEQLYFFKNAIMKITPEGIEKTETDKYVWEDSVIDFNFKKLDDFFKITYEKKGYNEISWDIEVKEKNCCFLNYVINTSRVYWREELEDRLFERDAHYIKNYQENHKFSIDGPLLNEEEVSKQKMNLVSKIFTIGYLLHRYKGDSIAWAPFLMDGAIGKDGQCNGRSGKSFFLKALTSLLDTKRIDGRGDVKDNKFLFDGVTDSTDLVYIDDADENFPIKRFYSLITADLHVNPKGDTPFSIPFERAPKIAFSSNYVPYDFDSSTMARLLFVVFSDYYHEKTPTNGYRESRSIRDDFGKDLMRDYTEEEWNLDYNFLLQCLQFYLKVMKYLSVKIQPPMDAIMTRKYRQDMGGEAFEDWAFTYFAEDGHFIDRKIVYNDAFTDFLESANYSIKWKPQRFDKALKAFADYCPYIHAINPKDVQQKSGRIQVVDSQGKTVKGLYMRSKKEYLAMQEEKLKEQLAKDDDKKYDF